MDLVIDIKMTLNNLFKLGEPFEMNVGGLSGSIPFSTWMVFFLPKWAMIDLIQKRRELVQGFN